ncbi:MAG: LysR family transcriptional regulator [Rhodoglobus sp.]
MSESFDPSHPRDIDLVMLTIAREIHDGGSLTAAATRMGVSQPALSQHIRRLESKLGIALTTRVGRSLQLTEAGMVLAKHAVAVEASLDSARRELSDIAELVGGRLRLAAFPSASSSIVPTLLKRMHDDYPGVRVTFVEEEPPEAAQLLRDDRIDLAITFSYPDDLLDPHSVSTRGLAVHDLFTEPVLLTLPRDHPAAGEEIVDMARLSGDDWIAGCPRCRGHLLELCRSAGFEPHITRETDHSVAVLGMVSNGMGVAMLPSLALSYLAIPSGVVLRETSPRSPRQLHAVTSSEASRIPSVATALAVLSSLTAPRLAGSPPAVVAS